MATTPQNPDENPSITIAAFVAGAPADLSLGFVAGERGAEARWLRTPRIQKLGLALAGFPHYVHEGRVQIIGQSELQFLGQLTSEERRAAVAPDTSPDASEEAAAAASEALGPRPPRIIAARRYNVKPMTAEEAVLLLAEGDDQFLVFRDSDTNRIGVLYKRKDGNYGLIEP